MQCAHKVKNSIGGVFLSRFFATHLHCGPVLAYSFYGYLSHPAKGCVRPAWTTSSLQMPQRISPKNTVTTNITITLSQNSMLIIVIARNITGMENVNVNVVVLTTAEYPPVVLFLGQAGLRSK